MAFSHRYKCSTEWKEFQRSNGRFWSSVYVDCEATGQWSTINLPCECKFMCHVHAICWHSIASIIHKGVKNVVLVTLMREYVKLLRHQILIWYFWQGRTAPAPRPARPPAAGWARPVTTTPATPRSSETPSPTPAKPVDTIGRFNIRIQKWKGWKVLFLIFGLMLEFQSKIK